MASSLVMMSNRSLPAAAGRDAPPTQRFSKCESCGFEAVDSALVKCFMPRWASLLFQVICSLHEFQPKSLPNLVNSISVDSTSRQDEFPIESLQSRTNSASAPHRRSFSLLEISTYIEAHLHEDDALLKSSEWREEIAAALMAHPGLFEKDGNNWTLTQGGKQLQACPLPSYLQPRSSRLLGAKKNYRQHSAHIPYLQIPSSPSTSSAPQSPLLSIRNTSSQHNSPQVGPKLKSRSSTSATISISEDTSMVGIVATFHNATAAVVEVDVIDVLGSDSSSDESSEETPPAYALHTRKKTSSHFGAINKRSMPSLLTHSASAYVFVQDRSSESEDYLEQSFENDSPSQLPDVLDVENDEVSSNDDEYYQPPSKRRRMDSAKTYLASSTSTLSLASSDYFDKALRSRGSGSLLDSLDEDRRQSSHFQQPIAPYTPFSPRRNRKISRFNPATLNLEPPRFDNSPQKLACTGSDNDEKSMNHDDIDTPFTLVIPEFQWRAAKAEYSLEEPSRSDEESDVLSDVYNSLNLRVDDMSSEFIEDDDDIIVHVVDEETSRSAPVSPPPLLPIKIEQQELCEESEIVPSYDMILVDETELVELSSKDITSSQSLTFVKNLTQHLLLSPKVDPALIEIPLVRIVEDADVSPSQQLIHNTFGEDSEDELPDSEYDRLHRPYEMYERRERKRFLRELARQERVRKLKRKRMHSKQPNQTESRLY